MGGFSVHQQGLPLWTAISTKDLFSDSWCTTVDVRSERGNNVLHYLDNFILAAGLLAEANYQKEILISTCSAFGVPLEPTKLKGPFTCLNFLGIEYNTMSFQLHLPMGKLARLKAELPLAISWRSMTKNNLQSLTGLLQHATKVIQCSWKLFSSPSLPQHCFQDWHYLQLVAYLCGNLEWLIITVEHGHSLSRNHSSTRCIWILGLCGILLNLLF